MGPAVQVPPLLSITVDQAPVTPLYDICAYTLPVGRVIFVSQLPCVVPAAYSPLTWLALTT